MLLPKHAKVSTTFMKHLPMPGTVLDAEVPDMKNTES